MTPQWPDWSDETVVIVAAGPSARDAPLELARGRARFLAINESWRLSPWADVLYACDFAWWRLHDGVPEYSGLKLSQDARACAAYADLRRVHLHRQCDVLMSGRRGHIGDGGNSGFQALNLAIQFGAARILLVGYDMTLINGAHWHGHHPHGLNNPRPNTIARWLAACWSTPDGVEIVNCHPGSALAAYPKLTFEDACRRCL